MKKLIKALSTCLLLVLMAVMFVGCVPSNVEKAKEKMQDAGYSVLDYEEKDEDAEGLIGGIIAKKGLIGGESLTALYFADKDDAEDYYEDVIGKNENVQQKGKWVFWGTEEAIKEFK